MLSRPRAISSPFPPRRAAVGICVVLCVLAAAALPAASPAAPVRPEDPARGIQLDGLVADPSCPDGLRVQVPRAPDACTHGPDPAPPGEDVRERRSIGELRAEEKETQLDAAPELADCIGDGASGDRVELIYARASDRPDRYASAVSLIQSVAGDMAERMKQSAAESGGYRTLRYVTEGCNVVVRNVVLSPAGDDNLGNTASELAAKGYNRSDRKYLTFVDAYVYCGVAYAPGNVARVDARCWDGHAGLHELMHNLSAVDPAAPNTSGGYHCVDESDLMCYSDYPYYPQMLQVCPPSHEALLDCNGDDYFNTAPRAGSFPSRNPGLNTADSTFVADRDGQLPVLLPPAPPGYRGPRYTIRADNADDDLCVYAIRPTTGARVRLFCVGNLGDRSADVTGALISVAGGAGTVGLRLVATDRGGATRAYGFRVARTGSSTPVLDERDGVAGQQSSSAPLGANDPSTGFPIFYDRTITLQLDAAPIAAFSSSPASPLSGEAVTFSSSSTDPDGSITLQQWDLDGDGQYDDASGASASRAFASPGSYGIGLRVTDDAGLSATAQRDVTVGTAPTPDGGASGSGAGQSGAGAGATGAGSGAGQSGVVVSGSPPSGGGASAEDSGISAASAICRSTRASLAGKRVALSTLRRGLASQARSLTGLKKRLSRGGLTKREARRYAAAVKRLNRRQKEGRTLAAGVKRLEQLVAARCG